MSPFHAFWSAQPAPGRDQSGGACIKRLRDLLQAFAEQIDMNQALEDHVYSGLEDLGWLESAVHCQGET